MTAQPIRLLLAMGVLVVAGCATVNTLRTTQSMAQVDDAPAGVMRKQLQVAGTPEADIDQAIKQMDEKMKAEGVPQAQRDYVLLQRRRPVTVHLQWQMEVKARNTQITYPCGSRELSGDFVCRYRLQGRATLPAMLDYVPLSETERILRAMGEIPALGPTALSLSGSQHPETVSVAGDQQAALSGFAKMTDRGARIGFSGAVSTATLFGEAPASASSSNDRPKSMKKVIAGVLQKQIEDEVLGNASPKATGTRIAEAGPAIDPDANQADYTAFLRQLFQTGHFRHHARWMETVTGTSGTTEEAPVEMDVDVELNGGPALDEVKKGAHP